MPSKKNSTIDIPASVPMPSADLINFRFDQTDKRFDELNAKLDAISQGFVTEKEMAEAKLESKNIHDGLQKQIDDMKKNAKWIVGVVLSAMSVAAALLLVVK